MVARGVTVTDQSVSAPPPSTRGGFGGFCPVSIGLIVPWWSLFGCQGGKRDGHHPARLTPHARRRPQPGAPSYHLTAPSRWWRPRARARANSGVPTDDRMVWYFPRWPSDHSTSSDAHGAIPCAGA